MRPPARKKPRIPKPQGYHHGDLRRALIMAARHMVEDGGAQALSCAARRNGRA
jgi:hypothetical protein